VGQGKVLYFTLRAGGALAVEFDRMAIAAMVIIIIHPMSIPNPQFRHFSKPYNLRR